MFLVVPGQPQLSSPCLAAPEGSTIESKRWPAPSALASALSGAHPLYLFSALAAKFVAAGYRGHRFPREELARAFCTCFRRVSLSKPHLLAPAPGDLAAPASASARPVCCVARAGRF